MPTYITLVNFTEEGVEEIDDLPAQIERIKEQKRAMGGEPHGFYLTLGQYDMVAFSEMPDAVSTAQLQIGAAMEGGVETETLRAFDESEIEEILAGLPE